MDTISVDTVADKAQSIIDSPTTTVSVTDYYNGLKQVIGLPFHWGPRADPNFRSFLSHMFPGASFVGMRPGNVKFTDADTVADMLSSSLPGFITEDGKIDPATLYSAGDGLAGMYGADKESIDRINAELKAKSTAVNYDNYSKKPIRYFEFDPAVNEYLSYVSTMAGHMYSRMTGGNKSWAPPQPGSTSTGGFFTFWCEASTSSSESFSNEIGETMVGSAVKGIASMSRELQFFLGKDMTGEGIVQSSMQGLAGMISDENAGTIRAGLGDAIQGWIPTFPHMWKGSNFSREYNLSFKFYSPYGDPYSCYTHVLLPFSMLLALVAPRQSALTAYKSPFVFQLDLPGILSCDLGIATSLSYVKGGSDNRYSLSNIPQQIDVTLSVTDLYPTMMQSNNASALFTNIGLATFLDTLAGVNIAYTGSNIDVITRLKTRMNSLLNKGAGAGEAINAAKDQFFINSGMKTLSRIFGG